LAAPTLAVTSSVALPEHDLESRKPPNGRWRAITDHRRGLALET